MRFKLSLLAAIVMLMPLEASQAAVQYVFGVENLVGKTSTDGSLQPTTVRIGKFEIGFVPAWHNYDQWLANFIPMVPAVTGLEADTGSFLTAEGQDTGPWRMPSHSVTIEAGSEPAGFATGDQLYIWISNATMGSPTTQVALLTDSTWKYLAATNLPQPEVVLALQDESPILVVGDALNDHYVSTATEVGVRLVTRHIPVPSPEIAVAGPDNTDLVEGVTAVDFGTLAVNAFVTKQFTVQNLGNMPLTGVSASIVGVNPADFTVTVLPSASVPVLTGTTTLTVRYSPLTPGAKAAILRIANNDADEAPFDVPLTGTTPAGVILGQPSFVVNENAGSITIPVLRVGAANTNVNVQVTTVAGTAKPGDYTFTPAVQTLNFPPNDTAPKSVTITIVDDGTDESNETFILKLQGPTGGASLGTPSSASVTIVDLNSSANDNAPPSPPVITTPLANALVPAGLDGKVTITGTAKDNMGIQKVEARFVTVPPSAFTPATLSTPDGTSSSYTVALTPPLGGANTVEVVTTDYATPSNLTASATQTFRVAPRLRIAVAGTGSVTDGYLGSTPREVGKSITVAAKAVTPTATAEGTMFTGWTIGGTDVAKGGIPFTNARLGITEGAVSKNSLTFIFREGLELIANFIPNPFGTDVVGTYNGLVNASPSAPTLSGTPASNSTEGYLNVDVQKSGAFSGKLTIDGLVLNVAGMFDELGQARFGTTRALTLTVARTNKPSLTLKLDLGLAGGPSLPAIGKITGTVSATEFRKSTIAAASLVELERSHFTGATQATSVNESYLTVPVPAPTAWPGTRTDGVFTVVMPPVVLASQPDRIRVDAAFTTQDYPQGYGIGTIKVNRNGLVSLAGTLADGTIVSASGTLSAGYRVGLFAQIYNKLGFLGGWVTLNDADSGSDMKALGGMWWARPFLSSSHYYPRGWPEVLKVDLMGAQYEAKNNQSVLTAGTDVQIRDDAVNGNAELVFAEGALGTGVELSKWVYLSKADLVTKVPDNDPTFTLKMDRKNGGFSGTFSHVDDTTPDFKGTIYQKGPEAGGYGYFLTKQPKSVTYDGESGSVYLIGEP